MQQRVMMKDCRYKTLSIVAASELRYASVATLRCGANMPAHCALGPTRKQYEHRLSTFPSEYLKANGPGWPTSTPANEDIDVNDTKQPRKKQKTKPLNRIV